MTDFIIPAEIPSQNVTEKGRNWRARAGVTRNLRATWRCLCASGMAGAKIPRATGPRAIHIVAYRTRRCSDIANLIGGAKACIDGMVDAGLLQDDRDAKAHITYQQNVASMSPTGKPCTLISVEEIEHKPTDTFKRRHRALEKRTA